MDDNSYWGILCVIVGIGGFAAALTNKMGWVGWRTRFMERATRVKVGMTSVVLIVIGAVLLLG